jgi:hypothetical protein
MRDSAARLHFTATGAVIIQNHCGKLHRSGGSWRVTAVSKNDFDDPSLQFLASGWRRKNSTFRRPSDATPPGRRRIALGRAIAHIHLGHLRSLQRLIRSKAPSQPGLFTLRGKRMTLCRSRPAALEERRQQRQGFGFRLQIGTRLDLFAADFIRQCLLATSWQPCFAFAPQGLRLDRHGTTNNPN